MKFKLVSKFKPTGDQPQAIEKLTAGLKKGLRDQVLLGVTGSGKTFTIANVIAKVQKPTLVISHNKTLAAQLASEFQEFFPENAVHYFVSYYDYYQPEAYIPQTDTYIEKETSLNEEIDRLRHASTQALLSRQDVIVVASVSCIYGLGNPEEYQKIRLNLKVGEKRKRELILRQLNNMQYQRNDIDFSRGTFRVHGDTLEIFPAFSENEVLRVEFFGDEIERISKIDSLTGKPINNLKLNPVLNMGQNSKLQSIDIYPATHYITPLDHLNIILDQVRDDLYHQVERFKKQGKFLEAERLERRTNYDLEMIRETGWCNGIENYSRYFDGRRVGEPSYTLLDFFSYPRQSAYATSINPRSHRKREKQTSTTDNGFLTIIDESHMTIPQTRGMYAGDRSRKEILVEYGFRLSSCLDNRPLNFKEFEERINQVIYVSATPGPYELEKVKRKVVEQLIRPTGLLDPTIEVKPTKHQIDSLIYEIQKRVKKHQRVLVTTLTKRMAEDLADYLQEMGIKAYYLHSEIDTLDRLEILRDLRLGNYDVVVGINLLREGLDLPEVSLIAILDADKEGYLRSETALIQTMGRAARHKEGHIIMYADKITTSMKKAIGETNRRHKIQEEYNKKHGIKPKSIKKEIRAGRLAGVKEEKIEELEIKISQIPKEEIPHLIRDLENQMELAAQNLEFEKAAKLRDQIAAIKKSKKSGKEKFVQLKTLINNEEEKQKLTHS